MELDLGPCAQAERQNSQSARLARYAHLPPIEHIEILEVPDVPGDTSCEPERTEFGFRFDLVVDERTYRRAQHRYTCSRSVADQCHQSVQEEIRRLRWSHPWRRGARCGRHPSSIHLTAERAGEESRRQRVEIDPARGPGVEPLQTLGRSQQEARRLARTIYRQGDPCTHHVCACSFHLVERARLGVRDEHERVIERARLLLRLSRG